MAAASSLSPSRSLSVPSSSPAARLLAACLLRQPAAPRTVCGGEATVPYIDSWRVEVGNALGLEFDYSFLPAVSRSGGVLLAWRTTVWSISDVHLADFSLTALVRHLSDVAPWWLSIIYGTQEEPDKLRFLDELRSLRSSRTGPWAIVGDFNLILEARDKNNLNLNRHMMGRFRRLIDELELQELPLHGRCFTWSNERESPTLVKLDRVLFSADWEELFPSCLLQAASSVASVHCALLLHTCVTSPKAHRFRFKAFWPKFDGFSSSRAGRLASPCQPTPSCCSCLLKEGDTNTKFFHLHARARRRKNFITHLRDGDQLAISHDALQELASSHFCATLGTSVERELALDLHSLGLCPVQLEGLDCPFTEDEVWAVIKSLPSNKAPGPDSFTGCFYKTCCPVIKVKILVALNSLFLTNGQGFTSLNDALISLLPKKDEAVDVKDFRPISLIHSFGKLFSKILASCLSPRLDELVAPNQSAFIKGRSLHDNFRFVQLVARALHAKRVPRLLLKVDIAKAFDTVSWPFLLEVLAQLGFSQRWRDWISLILSASSSRVLVNGVPGPRFPHRRGLRQGDPLSPMLFILVMDVLNALLRKASDSGGFLPLNYRAIRHRASLYADDLVLFLSPVRQDLEFIQGILSVFGAASGLRTNFTKCSITPIR
uniref:Retrotransposon protein, putative, unclassified n=1 Tax=Oryza sativa subsp. japonica TaxID=39947 RepID=Q2QZN1_ORYSJ|nr:retrotransposon protein, putative, unclassified [Oryza sativa Japonica Group]